MKRSMIGVWTVLWAILGCGETGVIQPDVGSGTDDGWVHLGPPGSCPAGAELGCMAGGYAHKRCNTAGTAFEVVPCAAGTLCVGNGECKKAVCTPGERKCLGLTTPSVCADDLSGFVPDAPCPIGLVCDQATGVCTSSCDSPLKAQSNVGCQYMLVDLGNYESDPKNNPNPSQPFDDRPVMVVVSNASSTNEANVTITANLEGSPMSLEPATLSIPPEDLRTLQLTTGQPQLTTGINKWSWSLDSDQPVTVHLFNPENGPAVRSNDASLLFPTSALGTDYVVMGWRSFYTDDKGFDVKGYPKYGFDSYVTIVATSEGTTSVTVTPTANIRAGDAPGTTPVDKISKGQSKTFTLTEGDVLNYVIEPQLGEFDLTGTTVSATQSVAVFMAHNCAFVPSIAVKYCDHLEHQLAPVDTWGTRYVADRFEPRSGEGYDVWRIMALKDSTLITTDPVIEGVSGKTLNKHEWIEYQSNIPHYILSGFQDSAKQDEDAPIQVGHFMIGSNMPGFKPVCGEEQTGIGDPAFTVGVSTGQYLDHYVVLTPPGYDNDWLNIIRVAGEEVRLDGVSLAVSGQSVGSTSFELLRVPVTDGVHILDGDKPFGVTAYGYHCDVSYAYPGGMLLKSGP